MSLQPLTPVNCASLIQPGCTLLQLDGDVLLFGQKGWPKRSCPTGVFAVRRMQGKLKLRAISFSNDSCYIPPLRCPAVARMDPRDGFPEGYLIHGGRNPNNDISASMYLLTVDSRGCNRKLTLRCREQELAGELPGARYGHSLSVVRSHGKTACVLFGGRAYRPAGERTTECWNSVVDCPPQVFLVDREFGCSSAHTLPELGDGQSFHVALAREDSVYFLGGHSTSSDARPPRLVRLRVELLQGAPALSCETLDTGWSSTSAVVLRPGPAHRYIILGGYGADSQKRMECSAAVLDDDGIRFEAVDAPAWTADIAHSRTWFGGAAGGGSALIGVPSEGKATQQDAHRFYEVGFRSEEEGEEEETGGGALGCSQGSTDLEESPPLEDSEELYFGREPHELEDSTDGEQDTYNEDDEEDESQAGYWSQCCTGCQLDPDTWEPYYSTELHRPAMIFCSRGPEDGHWVHARCMELTESLLLQLSWGSTKYFCLDHGGLPRQEMTPPRKVLPIKHSPLKSSQKKKTPMLKMSPAKKSFLRRLFQ
ncbi:V(D)J recombination-activating protein 2 [Gadus morhua]|uniref:V(D)J recombination-activating protein 2 n=1 Tax=Gadus morhua TaxID=8049 RepID=UPI0011B4D18B|nr:V(D)J recombination-activating protein 2 [Gadus morhua]XP_030222167.1 V(D)J recombination-activating protein 2 [Gadus morhua]XP_030222168.1 V(D)J recombination-activating protein 2 [Gadus morhua]